MNATDAQLETASSSCGRWEWGCAALVISAVVVELVLATVHPSYDSPWNQWGSVFADAAIALGIVGEVLFGRWDAKLQTELRRRSNELLASAIQSAAQANMRAEQLRKAMAWRQLDEEKFKAALGRAREKATVELRYVDNDPESFQFAVDIQIAIAQAGWPVTSPKAFRYRLIEGALVAPILWPGAPACDMNPTGITIGAGSLEEAGRDGSAFKALEAGLLASTEAVFGVRIDGLSLDRLIVVVTPRA